MSPLDAAIVRRKLRRIQANSDMLDAAAGKSDVASYERDGLLRRAVERLLQETTDVAVDVNNMLLRYTGAPPAEDYFSSFIDLGRQGILTTDLARELAPAAGLRNRIVHEYEDLDSSLVLRSAQQAPALFGRYVSAIEGYLGKRGL